MKINCLAKRKLLEATTTKHIVLALFSIYTQWNHFLINNFFFQLEFIAFFGVRMEVCGLWTVEWIFFNNNKSKMVPLQTFLVLTAAAHTRTPSLAFNYYY